MYLIFWVCNRIKTLQQTSSATQNINKTKTKIRRRKKKLKKKIFFNIFVNFFLQLNFPCIFQPNKVSQIKHKVSFSLFVESKIHNVWHTVISRSFWKPFGEDIFFDAHQNWLDYLSIFNKFITSRCWLGYSAVIL